MHKLLTRYKYQVPDFKTQAIARFTVYNLVSLACIEDSSRGQRRILKFFGSTHSCLANVDHAYEARLGFLVFKRLLPFVPDWVRTPKIQKRGRPSCSQGRRHEIIRIWQPLLLPVAASGPIASCTKLTTLSVLHACPGLWQARSITPMH